MDEASAILVALGLPPPQTNKMSALTLLALCGLGPRGKWASADPANRTVTKGIMDFIAGKYGVRYAPNTRETFRRQVLHQLVQAGVAEYNPGAPDLPTNSPRAHYALTAEALAVVRAFGTGSWRTAVASFRRRRGRLVDLYSRRRKMRLVPVRLADGRLLRLSPGRHSRLQVAVVRKFAPRFAPGAVLAYLGDTSDKALSADETVLSSLGLEAGSHGKLPDVILHDRDGKRLFVVEAVTSHGPVTPKRVVELRSLLGACAAEIIFVTAFPDFATFRKHVASIAWETEVWIAEMPDHLIHYNGDKYLGRG
jgi:type II restriction enzyme